MMNLEELESALQASETEQEWVVSANNLARKLLEMDGERSFLLAQRALGLAEKLGDELSMAESFMNIGSFYGYTSDYPNALEIFKKATQIFEKNDQKKNVARALNALGAVYAEISEHDKALEYFMRSLELAGVENERQIIALNGNIGAVYQSLGEYEKALEYNGKMLELSEKIGNLAGQSLALNNFGISYQKMGDYAKAIECYFRSANLAEQENIPLRQMQAFTNIGVMYQLLNNPTSALDYYFRALQIAESIGNKINQAICLDNIGLVYQYLKNETGALSYYLKSLMIYESIGDNGGIAKSHISIADVLLRLGEADKSYQYFCSSLEISRETGERPTQAMALLGIGEYFFQKKEAKTAISYYSQALDIANSMKSNELTMSMLEGLANSYELLGDRKKSEECRRAMEKVASGHYGDVEIQDVKKQILDYEVGKAILQESKSTLDEQKKSTTSTFAKSTERQVKNIRTSLGDSEKVQSEKISHRRIIIKTFGHFSISVNGRELTTSDWQRKKARDVFKVLLLNYRKAVSADDLLKSVWGDNASDSVATLRNSISFIRKALEPDIKPQQESAYIKIADKSYTLDFGNSTFIDFVEFKLLCKAARKESNQPTRVTLLEKAVALYDGDFLKEDAYEEWAAFERETLKEMYIEILMELVEYATDAENADRAITFAKKVLESDRLYEDAYETIFDLLIESGQIAEAKKIWKQCREIYQKELNSQPPKRFERLFQEI